MDSEGFFGLLVVWLGCFWDSSGCLKVIRDRWSFDWTIFGIGGHWVGLSLGFSGIFKGS